NLQNEKPAVSEGKDHSVFQQGIGAVVARLIREVKPDTGPLDPTMTLELDLGFDSLSRVELLGQAEGQLGTHIDEERAARIFTLADFIEALSSSKAVEATAGHSWKEKLETP